MQINIKLSESLNHELFLSFKSFLGIQHRVRHERVWYYIMWWILAFKIVIYIAILIIRSRISIILIWIKRVSWWEIWWRWSKRMHVTHKKMGGLGKHAPVRIKGRWSTGSLNFLSFLCITVLNLIILNFINIYIYQVDFRSLFFFLFACFVLILKRLEITLFTL